MATKNKSKKRKPGHSKDRPLTIVEREEKAERLWKQGATPFIIIRDGKKYQVNPDTEDLEEITEK